MSNPTIPLRRARRRKEIKRKMAQLLNTLLMLEQVAEPYRNSRATMHFPSGGFFTKREDIFNFGGYFEKIRMAACPDDTELSCENFPDMTQPCDNTPYQSLHSKGYNHYPDGLHTFNTKAVQFIIDPEIAKQYKEEWLNIRPTSTNTKGVGHYDPIRYGFDLNEAVEQKMRNAENLHP